MKKIFLSGDPTHPLYHRYQNVAAALEGVFEAYEIACVSEHFETFETQDYEKYDLAVLYTDHWIDKTGTSHQQVQALVDYVAGGGALLGGLAALLSDRTGVRVTVAKRPLDSVALGIGRVIEGGMNGVVNYRAR